MIARTLGISRNTVRAALASERPPRYEHKRAGSAVNAFEDAIRAQLKDVPTMPQVTSSTGDTVPQTASDNCESCTAAS
jgi:hypothetical protein